MRYGTSYFPTWANAKRYYGQFLTCKVEYFEEEIKNIVNNKINSGEIHIGKPSLKPGQKCYIEDNRYFIED